MATKLFDEPKNVTRMGIPDKISKAVNVDNTEDETELIRILQNIKSEAEGYRNSFEKDWKKISDQINCVPPPEWDEKEDWQTKIFIPEQFKISETASAMLKEILGFIGKRRFYTVSGIDNDQDRQKETNLVRFMDIIFNDGGFFINNDFVLQEAIDLGTSFIKMLIPKDRIGIDFSWRTLRNTMSDPSGIVKFEDSKYVIEEYNEHVSAIMNNPLYSQKGKNKLLKHLAAKPQTDKSKRTGLLRIADSEGTTEYQISGEYGSVCLAEFWGLFPVKKKIQQGGQELYTLDLKLKAITLADDHIIMRNDDNDLGFSPYQWCRTKRRLNHSYGNGFCKNVTGLQELANSLINLGFDSAKIKSLGIIKVDEGAVADPSSIEFRPLARWRMQSGKMESATLEYMGEDTMRYIIKDLAYIDQLTQDASSVARQFQGATPAYEKQETLGQTQIKMQAAEKRFMKIAGEVTEDYIIPVVKKVFKIITNPKFIKRFQQLCNRTIGVRKETVTIPSLDPMMPPEVRPVEIPKLDLSQLGKMNLDFHPDGIVNYLQKMEVPKQMQELLDSMAQDPSMNFILAKEKILERKLSVGGVADYEDLFRTDEERERMQQVAQQNQEGAV